MIYHDTPTNVNIRYTCPITYSIDKLSDGSAQTTPFVWSHTNPGALDGQYRVTLPDASTFEVANTYTIEVKG